MKNNIDRMPMKLPELADESNESERVDKNDDENFFSGRTDAELIARMQAKIRQIFEQEEKIRNKKVKYKRFGWL